MVIEQFTEIFKLDSEDPGMCELPLQVYFYIKNNTPAFRRPLTLLRRDYASSWVVANERLYLTAIHAPLKTGVHITLATLFPGSRRVFAHWYTGEIKLPQSPVVDDHTELANDQHCDLFLSICNGVVVDCYLHRPTRSRTADSGSFGVINLC